MEKISIIFLCIIIGVMLRRFRIMPPDGAITLNRFVIYVALPALVLHYMHDLSFEAEEHALPIPSLAMMAWLVLFGSMALFVALGKWLTLDRHTVGALILTAGLGNTAFVGFPLVHALYGAEGMPIAIIIDQLGSFFALSSAGILIAFYYSGRTANWRIIAKKIVTFPPFVALIAAILLHPVTFPPMVSEWLEKLGATLVPLALTGVGMQLSVSREVLKRCWKALVAGLGYKLVLCPLMIYVIYAMLMPTDSLVFRVTVLEAAMAPMVTAGILAAEYELRAELAALMVGIGIPLSLVTVPLVEMLLR